MIIITQINYLIVSDNHSLFTNIHYRKITDLIKTYKTHILTALKQPMIYFCVFVFYKTERKLLAIK
jgi:hypothetical protein